MASGDTLAIFGPLHNEPTLTNFATLDTRNQHPLLSFDPTTNQDAVFSSVMPRAYGGGGVTTYVHYSMATAITGDLDWDVSFERIGDQQQDLDSDGFAAANSVDNTTVPGTAGLVDIVNTTFTDGADMDSIAVGEKYRVKVTRDAVSDTAAGAAQIVALEIKET